MRKLALQKFCEQRFLSRREKKSKGLEVRRAQRPAWLEKSEGSGEQEKCWRGGQGTEPADLINHT